MTKEIELTIQISLCTFNIEFQVMDITYSYNCLFRRPWIHLVGAVLSFLHQKLKFAVENHLLYVVAEEDMISATSSIALYVEISAEIVEFLSILGIYQKHFYWRRTKSTNAALIQGLQVQYRANHWKRGLC